MAYSGVFIIVFVNLQFSSIRFPIAVLPHSGQAMATEEELAKDVNRKLRLQNLNEPISIIPAMLTSGVKEFKHSIIGKFFTDGPLNLSVMKSTIIRAWNSKSLLRAVDLENDFILFKFSSPVEVDRAHGLPPEYLTVEVDQVIAARCGTLEEVDLSGKGLVDASILLDMTFDSPEAQQLDKTYLRPYTTMLLELLLRTKFDVKNKHVKAKQVTFHRKKIL
ncbi:hypothetical protein HHK36_007814 [Tetracentron sinense]|uniref:DUF4283 domain-containing protein n=1 Tax=Tetracentron sinense TaxID=13715 RepID=A0A835DMN0_TETSI|nr:hypothetical protein HHK36_007814 [Tetracentron sinense]